MQVEQLLRDVLKLQDEELVRTLLAEVEIRRLPRRELVVREGEVQRQIGFLLEGCLCGFSQNAAGEQLVTCFCCRPGEATMCAFTLAEPAVTSLIALTDSVVAMLPTERIAQLVETNPVCMRLYNTLLEQALRRVVVMQSVLRSSAMERYQWFLKEYPGLIDLINNKYIASYLQMTNVTLSRLRRASRRKADAAPAADE